MDWVFIGCVGGRHAGMNQPIRLDTELIDEMCLENEKSFQRMRGK